MTEPFNKLTEAELERLSYLLEECGEVIQFIGKVQKHGFDSRHPKYGDKSNRESLAIELSHLMYSIMFMIRNNDLDTKLMAKSLKDKRERSEKYYHHQNITKKV